jgi:uncharacterized protein
VAKFLVEFTYNVDRAGRQGLHPAHAENLYSLADRGVLLLGGPVVGENHGMLMYEVADREELQKLLDAEPYVQGGVVAETRVVQWEPGKGSWVTALEESARRGAAGDAGISEGL